MGTTQAVLRYEMRSEDYREKLLRAIDEPGHAQPDSSRPAEVVQRRSLGRHLVRPATGLAMLGVVALIGVGIMRYMEAQANIRWAKDEALPEIERLIESNWRDFTDAYELAVEAEQYIPDDAKLEQLLSMSSFAIDVSTDPPGASVHIKRYSEPGSDWRALGVTPIEGARVPVGIFRWKIEKEGYAPVIAAASSWDIDISLIGKDLLQPNHFMRKLDEEGSIPDGMVRVSGAQTLAGDLGDFFVDRYEVTHAQFKRFVEAGGYRNREWWQHEFVADGEVLSFEEAMALFVDQTGRPGPATWEAGDYREGTGDHPVSGVSWYEAQAYATSLGRQLPTGQHWGLARGEYTSLIQYATQGGFAILAPFSNFGGEGAVAIGSLPGITAYGVHDMAGNVREWCWNETPQGRLIRGGAWDDNHYRFAEPGQAPPFERSEKTGFRAVLYINPENLPESVFAPEDFGGFRDLYKETPVSDEIFEVYRAQFAYDRTALNANVDSRDEGHRAWIHERITLDAAYGKETLILHLFLPKSATPPYQTVIYFPGTGSLFQSSSDAIASYYEFPVFLSFLPKSGRAVVYPIYKGTFERRDDALIPLLAGDDSHAYTEWTVQLVKDFSRSIDYLETRAELDSERLAYYGMSWGGFMAAIIPAVEDRITVSVVLAGGLSGLGRPEANDINYVGRVTVPTLMMNGRYDTILRFETGIKPMYDLLGTPAEDKALKLFNTDHIPPRNEFIKETLAWLDRYLGPVGGG
jgi:hypothetical protein